MPAAALDHLIWSVAARFAGFSEAELWAMPMTRLQYWYQGHRRLAEDEEQAFARMFGRGGSHE